MDPRNGIILGGRPVARRFGAVNYRGLATMYAREMLRGFKIWGITLAAPTVRALLFASVFGLAIDRPDAMMGGVPFIDFLLPGLVAVAALERSFQSSAFSIVYDKNEGIFPDLAMLPLTPGEIVLAYAAASVSASLIVGAVVWAALLLVGGAVPVAPLTLIFFVALGSLMIALFSQITGLWARKWDYLESVQTFIFMPFVFLSGVFFSIDELSAAAQPFARANPVFYIVDGIRFAITGRADANPWVGAGVCIAVIVILWVIVYRLFAAGYRMKS
ncbi:MAG: ABC transporter permease [Rhodospirillaceae bacterium]|jgi:ABC-2 type transport system permease protein|nr:ABC transporter permease [Rhodospirillaceae bacterium]MBT3809087.1 ABC transporter permease [Rhodospirillaceae bacterium]MBT3929816.1 ABC transporter permease [Rhodospirillaceae bacterium]MBT4771682.1 ABC transporter permease [Rhodospirillaceae bacterium]MBT5357864.1 ABC transporter permease [Rhodospirillaceae bacterium]